MSDRSMQPIALQQFVCQMLPEAMQAAKYPVDAFATNMCSALQRANIRSFAWEPQRNQVDGVIVHYTDARGMQGALRFARDMRVYDGVVNQRPLAIGKNSKDQQVYRGARLVWAVLGASKDAKFDVRMRSAVQYLQCLFDSKKNCASAKQRAQDIAQREQLRAAEHIRREAARVAREKVARLDGDTQRMWKYFDDFFAEANRRDDNDSDLDVLIKIHGRYVHARPYGNSRDLSEAMARHAAVEKAYKEFTNSKHHDAYIFDEGDCTTVTTSSEDKPCPNACFYPETRMFNEYTEYYTKETCALGDVAEATRNGSHGSIHNCECEKPFDYDELRGD